MPGIGIGLTDRAILRGEAADAGGTPPPAFVSASFHHQGALNLVWDLGTFDLSDCDFAILVVTQESFALGTLPFNTNGSTSAWTLLNGIAQVSGAPHISAIFYLDNPGAAEIIHTNNDGTAATKNAILLRFAGVAHIGGASNALVNGPAYDPGAVRDHIYLSVFTTRLGTAITAPPMGFGAMVNDTNGGTSPSLAYAWLAANGQAMDPDAWAGGSTGRTNWTVALWG